MVSASQCPAYLDAVHFRQRLSSGLKRHGKTAVRLFHIVLYTCSFLHMVTSPSMAEVRQQVACNQGKRIQVRIVQHQVRGTGVSSLPLATRHTPRIYTAAASGNALQCLQPSASFITHLATTVLLL